MPPAPIITITTDFGLEDPYVAIMKGVILGIAPEATVIDVTHAIPPQDVGQGARVLDAVWPYFPHDAIHLAVVDPGVGTGRRPVAVESPHGRFVGPDNGLFCVSLAAQKCLEHGGRLSEARAVEPRCSRFRREPVSRTFHGRDIFAPAAAHLAAGVPLEMLGPPVERLVCPRGPSGAGRTGEDVRGHVVRIDHFGNAITDIPASLLRERGRTELGELVIEGMATSYQDADVVAIVGSHGHLEVAARNDSAAARFGLKIGDEVVVRGLK